MNTQDAGTTRDRVTFGSFEMDLETLELFRRGRRVRLHGQPARVLAILLRHPGELVTREAIRDHLWGSGTHVDYEQGINQAIRHLRAALGDDAEAPRYLETLPRLGYRFLAPVSRASAEEMPGTAEPPVPATVRPSRRTALLALTPAVALLAVLVSWTRTAPAPARPVVAVLPFAQPAGGTPPALAEILMEEVIARLGASYGGRLGVIARTSAMAYRDSGKDVRQIGTELGASHVLEGSIHPAGSEVRVSARLVRTLDQIPLWASTYQIPPNEAFALPPDLASRIARALALNLLSGDDRALPAARTRPEVFDLYLQGKSLLAAREPARAAALLERSLELDPGFAPAYLALARARQAHGPSHRERKAAAREAVERTLALDDGLVEAHVLMGNMLFYDDLDREAARREFERALRINPASAEAWHAIAAVFATSGDLEGALEAVNRALSYDPLHPMVAGDVGWYSYWARRYDEAIERSRRTLAMAPGYHWARRCLLLACLMKGDRDGAAREALDEMREAGAAAIEAGPPGDAAGAILKTYWRRELERTAAEVAARRRSPADLAMIQLVLGEHEEALDSLERAFEARAGWILPFLVVEPLADPLRGNPRFEALLRRIRAPR
jgi:TolB-like protein/Tfp pilus assembly protein PilF